MANDETPETVWCFEPRKELENFSTGEYMTIGDEESHAYTRSDLYRAALEEVERLREENGRLRAMVDALEWSGTCDHPDGGPVPCCPYCEGVKPGYFAGEYEGHTDACQLRALLSTTSTGEGE